MADWRTAAEQEGWTTFSDSVRVQLGRRKHKVSVAEVGSEYEFSAVVPPIASAADLVDLLVGNRSAGLAYWYVQDGWVWAESVCPKSAPSFQIAIHLRETAALADQLELRLAEVDLD